MRVVFNGISMLGHLTGVGHYCRQLLRELVAHPEVTEIGVFTGRRLVNARELIGESHHPEQRTLYEFLKRTIRRFPGSRQLVASLRSRAFFRHVAPSLWDVYHEPNYIGFPWCGPQTTTVCDLGFLRQPEYMPRDRVAWLASHLEASLRRSEVVLAISEFTRTELLDAYPWLAPQKVRVTPLGVDPPSEHPVGEEPSTIRRLELPEGFILFVGTLEPRKNLQGLTRAYRLLPEPLQRAFPLVVVGAQGWNDWYFRDELETLRAAGRLRLVGYVSPQALTDLYRRASVFCFPSHYEGFGLPPLEAAAVGTPVVCSQTASLPEVMGNAAVYVDPQSAESIAAALERVLEDQSLRAALRAEGPARASQFSWRRCATLTLAAYHQALQGVTQRIPIRRAS